MGQPYIFTLGIDNMKITIVSCLLIILQWGQALKAEMVFESTISTHTAEPGQKSVATQFIFKNSGDEQFVVTKVQSSCGCTVPKLEKTTYAPGETGVIAVTFDIGDRKGPQKKTIRVTTDTGQTALLKMNMQIPEILAIRPRLVFWRKGSRPDPKTVLVEIDIEDPINILEIVTESKLIATELIPSDDAGLFSLKITPKSTQERIMSRIILKTDYSKENPEEFHLFAYVK